MGIIVEQYLTVNLCRKIIYISATSLTSPVIFHKNPIIFTWQLQLCMKMLDVNLQKSVKGTLAHPCMYSKSCKARITLTTRSYSFPFAVNSLSARWVQAETSNLI